MGRLLERRCGGMLLSLSSALIGWTCPGAATRTRAITSATTMLIALAIALAFTTRSILRANAAVLTDAVSLACLPLFRGLRRASVALAISCKRCSHCQQPGSDDHCECIDFHKFSFDFVFFGDPMSRFQ